MSVDVAKISSLQAQLAALDAKLQRSAQEIDFRRDAASITHAASVSAPSPRSPRLQAASWGATLTLGSPMLNVGQTLKPQQSATVRFSSDDPLRAALGGHSLSLRSSRRAVGLLSFSHGDELKRRKVQHAIRQWIYRRRAAERQFLESTADLELDVPILGLSTGPGQSPGPRFGLSHRRPGATGKGVGGSSRITNASSLSPRTPIRNPRNTAVRPAASSFLSGLDRTTLAVTSHPGMPCSPWARGIAQAAVTAAGGKGTWGRAVGVRVHELQQRAALVIQCNWRGFAARLSRKRLAASRAAAHAAVESRVAATIAVRTRALDARLDQELKAREMARLLAHADGRASTSSSLRSRESVGSYFKPNRGGGEQAHPSLGHGHGHGVGKGFAQGVTGIIVESAVESDGASLDSARASLAPGTGTASVLGTESPAESGRGTPSSRGTAPVYESLRQTSSALPAFIVSSPPGAGGTGGPGHSSPLQARTASLTMRRPASPVIRLLVATLQGHPNGAPPLPYGPGDVSGGSGSAASAINSGVPLAPAPASPLILGSSAASVPEQTAGQGSRHSRAGSRPQSRDASPRAAAGSKSRGPSGSPARLVSSSPSRRADGHRL